MVLLEPAQSDGFDRAQRRRPARRLVAAAQFIEELNVGQHCAPGQQRGILKDVAEVVICEFVGSASVFEQPRRNAQHGRLSAAGWPDDGDELTGVDLEADLVERVGTVGKNHRHGVEFQQSFRARFC